MGEETPQQIASELARRLGAHHGWLVRGASDEELCQALSLSVRPCASLGGSPIRVEPIRIRARAAHEQGEIFVCDNSLATSALCAPAQLGADVVIESLDLVVGAPCGMYCVCISEGISVDLSDVELATESDACSLAGCLEEHDKRMRAACDAAHVVANYLSCHPKIHSVAYPGLKSDLSFPIAATTLHHGFGAFVDYRTWGDSTWHRVSCLEGDATEGAFAHLALADLI